MQIRTSRYVGMWRIWTASLALEPGASEREVEILLGSPAVVETERKEFEGDVRRLGDCLDGKRETVAKVWRYHKPEGQETIVAFDKDRRVLCAKAGGISIIH